MNKISKDKLLQYIRALERELRLERDPRRREKLQDLLKIAESSLTEQKNNQNQVAPEAEVVDIQTNAAEQETNQNQTTPESKDVDFQADTPPPELTNLPNDGEAPFPTHYFPELQALERLLRQDPKQFREIVSQSLALADDMIWLLNHTKYSDMYLKDLTKKRKSLNEFKLPFLQIREVRKEDREVLKSYIQVTSSDYIAGIKEESLVKQLILLLAENPRTEITCSDSVLLLDVLLEAHPSSLKMYLQSMDTLKRDNEWLLNVLEKLIQRDLLDVEELFSWTNFMNSLPPSGTMARTVLQPIIEKYFYADDLLKTADEKWVLKVLKQLLQRDIFTFEKFTLWIEVVCTLPPSYRLAHGVLRQLLNMPDVERKLWQKEGLLRKLLELSRLPNNKPLLGQKNRINEREVQKCIFIAGRNPDFAQWFIYNELIYIQPDDTFIKHLRTILEELVSREINSEHLGPVLQKLIGYKWELDIGNLLTGISSVIVNLEKDELSERILRINRERNRRALY